MSKDLTASNLRRQSVLNNPFALKQMESELHLGGIVFDGMPLFTKLQVAQFLDVDERTIDRFISDHNEELLRNGYRILRSMELRKFKELHDVDDINVVDIAPKIPQLGVFNFRAFLNVAMLVTNSEKARQIRSRILDVVTQVILEKVSDATYINQYDEDYLPAAFQEENYRKDFTSALSSYVEGNQWKYKHCTDAIYSSIFEERAAEYRKILNLQSTDNVRDTFYAELLTLIASFEAGLPDVFRKEFNIKGRKLTLKEAIGLIHEFGKQSLFKPLIQDVRTKIATRDFTLRDAIHNKLEAYIHAMPAADYERFLGEKSKALEERIKESLNVYKRLKDR